MENLNNLLEIPPFSLSSAQKQDLFDRELRKLTLHHYCSSPKYRKILDKMKIDPNKLLDSSRVPFLPVEIFKRYDLSSIDRSQIVSTLKSSGTAGQQVSKILLDKQTAVNQKKVLARITTDFIGTKRLPMLLLDCDPKFMIRDPAVFSARGAGLLGFSNFGVSLTFAFDNNMQLNLYRIETLLSKCPDQKILLFGFTFMVWQYFVLRLQQLGRTLPLEKGILIHGGGWKKLEDQAVDHALFRRGVREVSGITQIHNYYGMAEQAGSIFIECEQGYYHCSIYSDVFVRRNDFTLCDVGEQGLIEVLSLIPHSYPGHALLTEDLGTLLGEDDCPCGRLGKYFLVHGRIQQAEIKGCSDTY